MYSSTYFRLSSRANFCLRTRLSDIIICFIFRLKITQTRILMLFDEVCLTIMGVGKPLRKVDTSRQLKR
jgi:hypothetical protein